MLFHRRSLLSAGALLPLVLSQTAFAADAHLQKRLKGLSRLVGHWRGEGDGQPGRSTVERSYEPQLDGLLLYARNTSTYAPQERNPKGEVHHDLGYYSFDKARKRAVLRQFHSESFVAQYVASIEALDGAELVFDSEALENIPPGYRARETYRFTGPDSFEELFELADLGKSFEVYSHNRLKRVAASG